MTTPRRMKHAFRPTLGDAPLEERVVLSTVGASVIRNHDSLLQANLLNSLNDSLGGGQLRKTIAQQVRIATNGAQSEINSQIANLYSKGMPTAQQKADFLASANGVLDATAVRLSSMAALLPGGNDRLSPGIQRALIGSQSNSLASRIENAVNSNRLSLTAQSLTRNLTQAINTTTNQRIGFFNRYVNSNAAGFGSVDSTGTSIPLSQYIGNQVVTQLGNTLGSLSQSFPTMASTTLFPNGAPTSTPATQLAFANQYLPALNLAASQLSSGLALAPGLTKTLAPQLQNLLFGGTNLNTGMTLFGALHGLPTASTDFNNAASTAFTNGFQSLTKPLSTSFGLPSSSTFNLPTTNIPSLFGSQYSTYGNGYNNGFGSGFPGFGVAPTGFNTNFTTGFNNIINGANTSFGFRSPTLDSTGTLTGTGKGV